MKRIPSVLGGFRPVVRDPAADAFKRVQFLRAHIQLARETLQQQQGELRREEAGLAKYRQECKNCGTCSACIG